MLMPTIQYHHCCFSFQFGKLSLTAEVHKHNPFSGYVAPTNHGGQSLAFSKIIMIKNCQKMKKWQSLE